MKILAKVQDIIAARLLNEYPERAARSFETGTRRPKAVEPLRASSRLGRFRTSRRKRLISGAGSAQQMAVSAGETMSRTTTRRAHRISVGGRNQHEDDQLTRTPRPFFGHGGMIPPHTEAARTA